MIDEHDTPVKLESNKIIPPVDPSVSFPELTIEQTDPDPSTGKEGDAIVGTTVAQTYEVIAVLGKGGMSTVYLARHLIMKNFVALKMMHLHLMDNDVSIRRFKQEAQMATQLNKHANVICIFDCNSFKGQPYIVMDFVDGQSLASTIQSEKLTLDDAIDIFIQVCDGLQYAHNKGIIHRDLKPSNIMLAKSESGKLIPKIVDFGIAKLLPQEAEGASGLTRTGETFGSPLYMSPEQCLAQPLDARSDVYSMGCLMYEVIAGQAPLSGGNLYETIFKQINEAPPSLAPFIDDRTRRKPLERVVLKCLAKEKERRYKDMAELIKDLKLLQKQEKRSLVAALINAWELQRLKVSPQERKRRNLYLMLGSTAIVVAVLLVSGDLVRKYIQNKESGTISLARNEILWSEPFGLGDFKKAESPDLSKVLEEQAMRALDEKLALGKNNPMDLFNSYLEWAHKDTRRGTYALAADSWMKALAVMDAHPDQFMAIHKVGASRGLGFCQYRQGNWGMAKNCFTMAINSMQPFINPGMVRGGNMSADWYAELIAARGDCYYRLAAESKLARPVELLNKANLDFETALINWQKFESGHSRAERIALALSKMGDVNRRLADEIPEQRESYLEKAVNKFSQAKDKWAEVKGPVDLNVGLCLNYLGMIHTQQGLLGLAESEFKQSKLILEKQMGDGNELFLSNLLANYSKLLEKRFNFLEMISVLDQADRIRQKHSERRPNR